jgi:hypothetical protein
MVRGYSDNKERNKKRFQLQMTPHIHPLEAIPYPAELYANMQDNQSTASCADLDQTLAINAAMATTMLGIVQNFYYVKPFRFWRNGISLEGGSSTSFLTFDEVNSRGGAVLSRYLPSLDMDTILNSWYSKNSEMLRKMQQAADEAVAANKQEVKQKQVELDAEKEGKEVRERPIKKPTTSASAEVPSLTPIPRAAPAVPLIPVAYRAEAVEVPEVDEGDFVEAASEDF